MPRLLPREPPIRRATWSSTMARCSVRRSTRPREPLGHRLTTPCSRLRRPVPPAPRALPGQRVRPDRPALLARLVLLDRPVLPAQLVPPAPLAPRARPARRVPPVPPVLRARPARKVPPAPPVLKGLPGKRAPRGPLVLPAPRVLLAWLPGRRRCPMPPVPQTWWIGSTSCWPICGQQACCPADTEENDPTGSQHERGAAHCAAPLGSEKEVL